MQFSKSAGKHWTELPLSLSLSLLFSYVAPCILPLPSPLSTFLSPPFILGHRRILSRGGDGTYTLSLSPHFRRCGIHAPISTFFFDEI